MRYLSSFFISVFTLCLWLASANTVQASHFSGANITYECMSGCTYRVYVHEYYSCGGAPIGPNLTGTLAITPAGGCTSPSPTSGWVSVSQNEVTPICPANIGMTTCNGGSAINGIIEVVNYRDYDFCSAPCPSYTLEYGHCCRNGSMVNVVPAGSYDVLVTTEIFPNGNCNTSPQFLDPSPIYLESGTPARVSVAAYDADGDSLEYEFTNCSETSGPIPYAPGYNNWQPMGSNWNLDITEGTGDILFAPNPGSVGTYILCVKVSEYRNGVLLGTYINDLMVYSLPSSATTNDPPYIPGVGANVPPVTGGSYIDSFIVSATVNVPLEVPIHAFDINLDSTVMTWSGNIPGATFTKVGNSSIADTIADEDPQGLFAWTPTTHGRYSFTVDLEGWGCYVTGNSEYTYVIDVDSIACSIAVDVGPDVQICNGDIAMLNSLVTGAIGPVQYTWSTGDTSPNTTTSVAGTYILFVVDSVGCGSSDTVEVTVVPTPTVNAGGNITICNGSTTQLNGTGNFGLTYQWSPATNLSNANIPNPIFTAPPVSGNTSFTYYLTGTDFNGCSSDDSVVVTVVAPVAFSLTTSNDTICFSDTALISYNGPSGFVYTWDFDGGTVISGSGTGPYEISWSGASAGPKMITLSVDSAGCITDDSISVFVDPNCVWPGDADDDGIADNNDLLALGLAYGSTGPVRLNASLNWVAQPATPWNDTIPGGINEMHSDTDGNGVVNDDDTLAIVQNYGQTHNKTTTEEGGPGDPPLLLLPMVDSSLVGDTLHLPIVLGLDTLPVASIYGLAFTITYDNTLVDSASAQVNFSSSWLGTLGSNMISIQKDMFNDGEIDVALTRTDKMNTSGYGNLGYFSIVMVDDISGKNDVSEILKLDITNVRVITNTGEVILVNPEPTEIVVTETTTGIDQWGLLSGVKMYPNPNTGIFFVEVENAQELDIEIYTLQGQKIYARKSQETTVQLDLSDQPRGMYLISISSNTQRWTGKIQLNR